MSFRTALLGVLAYTLAMPAAADTHSDLSLYDLFRGGNIGLIDLSPGGELVVYQEDQRVFAGNEELGYVLVYGFSKNLRILNIEWVGPATLIIQTRNNVSGDYQMRATKLGMLDDGEFGQVAYQRHEVHGYVHDALLNDPDFIEFARFHGGEDMNTSELFRFNLFGKTARSFRKRQSVETGSKDYYYYLKDDTGNYIVGMRYVDSTPELWQRATASNSWVNSWTGPSESVFRPIQISANGKSLWALTNAFTDKIAAVEFDLETATLKRVIFEHERVDLVGIILPTADAQPIAATYREQGITQYHFFTDDAKNRFAALQAKFPDKRLRVVGRSAEGSVQLIATSSSRDRGQIRRCDLVADSCEILMPVAPWLEDKPLSETIVLQVPSDADITVEAFLTLPSRGGDSIPLITMPHGGPIGIKDSRDFSPGVQWLAHNGYAVLRINYRGSGGYGKKFENAGLQQWGRGIEDDIEAAVKFALDEYSQLDEERVGIFGVSYGGYSALMSVIRNPDLFICGASFAGVTDLTLIFSQSRMQKNERLRKSMEKIVGSPTQDYAEQRANSPVYRYKEIERPILLAHGTSDFVVDIEHSWRLRKLLQLNGSDPEFIILDDVGHGVRTPDEAEELYDPLIAFLDKHLKP